MLQTRLRITEIFYSLQGESKFVGLPTVFVRLTGCPLRCGYCDTEYAFQGGEYQQFDDIINEIAQYNTLYVCVTGGEPLAQKNCLAFLDRLVDAGYYVSLETSGAIDVCDVNNKVVKVMDIKTPGSGEKAKNRWENISCLRTADQVKFVIIDREDYDWAKAVIEEYQLSQRTEVLMSPAFNELPAKRLAEWILEDQLQVRFQLQLHKILWGEEQGR